jgi:hypothetical protein
MTPTGVDDGVEQEETYNGKLSVKATKLPANIRETAAAGQLLYDCDQTLIVYSFPITLRTALKWIFLRHEPDRVRQAP